MAKVEKSLEESQAIADRLRESQLLHSAVIAAQYRAQENLQTNLRVSQALIEQTSATAANLQVMIDESYGSLRDSPRLVRGIFGSFVPGALSALVFSFIGAHNLRAGIAALLVYLCECSYLPPLTLNYQSTNSLL